MLKFQNIRHNWNTILRQFMIHRVLRTTNSPSIRRFSIWRRKKTFISHSKIRIPEIKWKNLNRRQAVPNLRQVERVSELGLRLVDHQDQHLKWNKVCWQISSVRWKQRRIRTSRLRIRYQSYQALQLHKISLFIIRKILNANDLAYHW